MVSQISSSTRVFTTSVVVNHIVSFVGEESVGQVSKIFYQATLQPFKKITCIELATRHKAILQVLMPFIQNRTLSPLMGIAWKDHTLAGLYAIFGQLDPQTKNRLIGYVRNCMDVRYRGGALMQFKIRNAPSNTICFFTNFFSRDILQQIKKINISLDGRNIEKMALRYFPNLTSLHLDAISNYATQERLDRFLVKFAPRHLALEQLTICGNKGIIPEEGLRSIITHCTALFSLRVMDCTFDDATYAFLAAKSECLQVVDLTNSRITINGLQSLSTCQRLETLESDQLLSEAETTAVLKLLNNHRCFPSLTNLQLKTQNRIPEEDLQRLQKLRPLTTFNFQS